MTATRPSRLVLGSTLAAGLLLCDGAHCLGQEAAGAVQFKKEIRPILEQYCYDCHGDGEKKGNLAFDELKTDADLLDNTDLWLKALKNLRAGLMPPPKKTQPNTEQKQQIERWIKASVFKADPANPDPGHITVRRLNRTEYRNTIRDLMGIDFDTENEFPPDDAGHGFDNIGEVLTLSPMLLEKYIAAAKRIVSRTVPDVSGTPAEKVIYGRNFRDAGGNSDQSDRYRGGRSRSENNALTLSYYENAAASNTFSAQYPGKYQLVLDFNANERFVDNQFDQNKCRFVFKADGKELLKKEYSREANKAFHFEFDQEWKAGDHEFTVEVQPLTPDEKQNRSLTLRLESVTVRGPLDPKYWVRPKNYEHYFSKEVPSDASARRNYAREILEPFARKAYRRPVDTETVNRLMALAESVYSQKGKTFEAGIGQAMVAVLASPRFLFREEGLESEASKTASATHPLVDEFALASRLSYFLWSSMPDDELFRLAGEGKLRANLQDQTKRLLADRKSSELIRNFVGQWLQTRDIETVQIEARDVLRRESNAEPDFEKRRARFRELRDKSEETLTPEEKKELEDFRASFVRRREQPLRADLTGEIRRAMRYETERTFDYILREDRSLLELLDSDYTFLNERLARHYGLTNLNVTGDSMQLVKLPADSPRGGIITHGSVLAVTSNPTRTSPVKRGLFILDNLLGTPPAPPPPNIPTLEEAVKDGKERTTSLREMLALHREAPLCSSCHNRMDPLGLALENFNAMGMWREQERGQPIDPAGKLLTGESFTNVKELKKILAANHATEFYRTITEKLLTYALGRGLKYYDVATVDTIVERLQKSNGRPSELLMGVIESAPFQKTRAFNPAGSTKNTKPATQRADARSKP